jgi:uncharacterized protein DUF3850
VVTHKLRVYPEFFAALESGAKPFEVRKDDRNFKVGDRLQLDEWDHATQRYTCASLYRQITYRLDGGQFGIEPGYCVLGIGAIP